MNVDLSSTWKRYLGSVADLSEDTGITVATLNVLATTRFGNVPVSFADDLRDAMLAGSEEEVTNDRPGQEWD